MKALQLYKTILIISPQHWEHNRVSKHHYAEILASQGHRVFFLEPPQPSVPGCIKIEDSHVPNLAVISHATWFPYWLKFKARWVFDLLMRRQAKLILAKMDEQPDLVWDFDNAYQFSDLRVFGAKLNIFHPVDNLPKDIVSSKFADVVLSNAQRYLNRIESLPSHSLVVEHGVSAEYLKRAVDISKSPKTYNTKKNKKEHVKIGYVGNLRRPGIDWEIIRESCICSPAAEFVFIGPFDAQPNRPQAKVRSLPNTRFVGPMSADEILELSKEIDIWFMAYDRQRDIDGGTNPHKLLEYLATGKTVVTNWVESYCEKDLIIMPSSSSNDELPRLLKQVISELNVRNSPEEQARRASYTLDLGYHAHIAKIHAFLQDAIEYKRDRLSDGKTSD